MRDKVQTDRQRENKRTNVSDITRQVYNLFQDLWNRLIIFHWDWVIRLKPDDRINKKKVKRKSITLPTMLRLMIVKPIVSLLVRSMPTVYNKSHGFIV